MKNDSGHETGYYPGPVTPSTAGRAPFSRPNPICTVNFVVIPTPKVLQTSKIFEVFFYLDALVAITL